ncbi:MAG TPA: hypothetical protein VD994_11750 [Prosthecobacter sp.]|nr:hypothetical protein [Prosthecobacter sp.]
MSDDRGEKPARSETGNYDARALDEIDYCHPDALPLGRHVHSLLVSI